MHSDAFRRHAFSSRSVESRRPQAQEPKRRPSYLELLAKSPEKQNPPIDNPVKNDCFYHLGGALLLTEKAIGIISRNVGLRVERNTYRLPPEGKIEMEYAMVMRELNIDKELQRPYAADLRHSIFYKQVIHKITNDPDHAKNIAWGMLNPDKQYLAQVYNNLPGQTDSGTGSITRLTNEVIEGISRNVGLRVERNTYRLSPEDKIRMGYAMIMQELNIDKKLQRPYAANLRYSIFYEQVIRKITNDPNHAKNIACGILNPDEQYLVQVYNSARGQQRHGSLSNRVKLKDAQIAQRIEHFNRETQQQRKHEVTSTGKELWNLTVRKFYSEKNIYPLTPQEINERNIYFDNRYDVIIPPKPDPTDPEARINVIVYIDYYGSNNYYSPFADSGW
jgi:hypothetical protein